MLGSGLEVGERPRVEHDDQEDDRQARQQDRECDLVRGLLPQAPSTSAIIRSTNVSPGLAVICTTMRSHETRVPPVTALRSPPGSRTTGADRP